MQPGLLRLVAAYAGYYALMQAAKLEGLKFVAAKQQLNFNFSQDRDTIRPFGIVLNFNFNFSNKEYFYRLIIF